MSEMEISSTITLRGACTACITSFAFCGLSNMGAGSIVGLWRLKDLVGFIAEEYGVQA